MASGVVSIPLEKKFLLSSMITVRNLVAVRHTVWKCVGGPRNWERWACPLDSVCLTL